MAEMVMFKGTMLPNQRLSSTKFEQSLQTASDSVEVAGGDGLPYLKLNKVGEWGYGKDDTDVEEGSHWAINPATLEKGYIFWKNRKATKRMKNIQEGLVSPNELPLIDGGDWKENVSFQLQCIYGEDTGTVLNYESSAYGGRSAWKAMVVNIRKQMHEDPKRMVPVVELLSESYIHSDPTIGKVWNPIFRIVKWIGYDGAQDEPAQPEPQPEEQNPKSTPQAEAASAKTNGKARRRVAPAPVTDVEEEPPAKPASEPAADPVQRRRRRAAA